MQEKQKKPYHHGNLRDALVEAAIPILREKGLVGLSLRELANALGVSHSAPYRHFCNKTALLKAIAIEGYRRLGDACIRARETHPDDPRLQLHDAGIGYLQFVARNHEVADLMFGRLFAGDADQDDIHEAASLAVKELAVIVENGKRAGLYGQRDTDQLVMAALSAVHGLSMMVSGGFLGERADSEDKRLALGDALFTIVTEGMFVPETHRH